VQSPEFTVDVPYVSQLVPVYGVGRKVSFYACGPASAAMLASYFTGMQPDLGRAITLAGGNAIIGRGTQPWQVAQIVRTLAPGVRSDTATAGSWATARSVLAAELGGGRPFIALVRPSWVATTIDHYTVVTGVNGRRGTVTLNDPLAGDDVTVTDVAFIAAWQRIRWVKPFMYIWAR